MATKHIEQSLDKAVIKEVFVVPICEVLQMICRCNVILCLDLFLELISNSTSKIHAILQEKLASTQSPKIVYISEKALSVAICGLSR